MGEPRLGGLRVLVVGGGIGGLCLGQGLRANGVDVTVYERDAGPEARYQGYRLHISPEGEQAMRECLPAPVVRLIAETANIRPTGGLLTYDEQLTPQWTPTFEDPRGNDPNRIDAVDRVTLRHALLAGLDDVVRFGHRCIGYEVLPSGEVVAHFEDGRRAVGDVLVAADGANSRIRETIPGAARPRDLGIRTIFGRIPRTDAAQEALAEELRDRFSYVIGSDGYHVGLMPMVFRDRPDRIAARLFPGAAMPFAEDYYMCVFNLHEGSVGMPDADLLRLTGDDAWRLVLERTSGWHPGLREVLRYADTSASFVVPMRAIEPVQPWPAGPVVALGDAVHTMPPSGGVGANTALRDAAALTRVLTAVDAGKTTLAEAIAEYQAAMVKYATESVQMSLRIAEWSIPAAGSKK